MRDIASEIKGKKNAMRILKELLLNEKPSHKDLAKKLKIENPVITITRDAINEHVENLIELEFGEGNEKLLLLNRNPSEEQIKILLDCFKNEEDRIMLVKSKYFNEVMRVKIIELFNSRNMGYKKLSNFILNPEFVNKIGYLEFMIENLNDEFITKFYSIIFKTITNMSQHDRKTQEIIINLGKKIQNAASSR